MKIADLLKILVSSSIMFHVTSFSMIASAGHVNLDKEKDVSASSQPTKPFKENKLSHHQLSVSLMIPVGGGAGSIDFSCGAYDEEDCPEGKVMPIPGVSLQYDFRPFKYFSLGTGLEYQSFFDHHSHEHQAEIVRLAVFVRGILPFANNRFELYLQAGYFLGFNWFYYNNKYYGFNLESTNFMASIGTRLLITKRLGVFLDYENDFGFIDAAILLYFSVKSGVVINF